MPADRPPIVTGGETFRVYTPNELRYVQLRPSYRPVPQRGFVEEVKEAIAQAKAMGPRKLLVWTAVAIATTLGLFALLLVIANLTDDTLVTKKERIAITDEEAPLANGAMAARLEPMSSTPSSAPDPVVEAQPTDFEIPDDFVPPPRTAAKPKTAPRQGKSVGGQRLRF